MTHTLESLLEKIPTDDKKLEFLEKIYTPGNTEVVNIILDRKWYSAKEIIESELKHLKDDEPRLKEFIDKCMTQGFEHYVGDELDSWGTPSIAEYVIGKLEEQNTLQSIEYAARLAGEFSMKDQQRQLKEKELELRLEEDWGRIYAARLANELGKTELAIKLYLKCRSYEEAMDIAKDDCPDRVLEVAEACFRNRYVSNDPAFYVECAKIIGKEKQAARVLSHQASRVKIEESPRHYQELVNTLILLGKDNEAKRLVDRVAAYQRQRLEENPANSGVQITNQIQMAELFLAVGDKEGAAEAYMSKFYNKWFFVREGYNDIDKAFELTGNSDYMQKKIELLIGEGNYKGAAEAALKMGDTELAEAYSTMHKMKKAAKKHTK